MLVKVTVSAKHSDNVQRLKIQTLIHRCLQGNQNGSGLQCVVACTVLTSINSR